MKATKNQATAVRAYLTGIGHSISHVQALEVIARGCGHRSRHVKSATTVSVQTAPTAKPGSLPAVTEQSLAEVLRLSGNILELSESMRAMPPDIQIDMGYADGMAQLHQQLGRAILSVQLAEHGSCAEGVSGLTDGYRRAAGRIYRDGQQALPAEAVLANDEKLALRYGEDNEHPDYPRGDWLFQASTLRTTQTYWNWVVTRLESIDSDELAEVYVFRVASGEQQAENIKASYLAGPCAAADVEATMHRLMRECPELFPNDRKAWEFIMDEKHEDPMYVIQMESPEFGNEVFTYDTCDERRAGLSRLLEKAVALDDGVERNYYFSDIDSDLEKNSPEYDEALNDRDWVVRMPNANEMQFDDECLRRN